MQSACPFRPCLVLVSLQCITVFARFHIGALRFHTSSPSRNHGIRTHKCSVEHQFSNGKQTSQERKLRLCSTWCAAAVTVIKGCSHFDGESTGDAVFVLSTDVRLPLYRSREYSVTAGDDARERLAVGVQLPRRGSKRRQICNATALVGLQRLRRRRIHGLFFWSCESVNDTEVRMQWEAGLQ